MTDPVAEKIAALRWFVIGNLPDDMPERPGLLAALDVVAKVGPTLHENCCNPECAALYDVHARFAQEDSP